MRYIEIGGQVIPKKCIFGPRPAEGLVFNNYEWLSITDHLVKDQRERELAAASKAKEEAKKELSYKMTSTWSNTLASIKTQGNQKRLEKAEKEKQEKINAYNQILKSRVEEKKEILSNVKEKMYQENDDVKTINSAVCYTMVLDGLRKQIEFQNFLKSEEEKKQLEMEELIKKDLENYERERYQEKLNEEARIKIEKRPIEQQIAEIQRRRRELQKELEEGEEKDAINMKLEGEKIHHCNMVEQEYRKNFSKRYMKKIDAQIEFQRNLALEEEEENEIIRIYNDYSRKFRKERAEREEKMKNEQIERRMKISEMLASKLADKALKEEESFQSAVREKEEQARKEEEDKKEKERLALESLLEGKKKSEEERARKEKEKKEQKKWEVLQTFRAKEVNEEWKQSEQKRKEEELAELKEFLARQIKENEERRAKDLEEWLAPLEDTTEDNERLLKYIDETMNFLKENNLPDDILQGVIKDIKKLNNIEDKESKKLEQIRKEKEKAQQESRKSRSLGNGSYCFKC